MQTISITRNVVAGCPPRQYSVTFQVGDERHVLVASEGRQRTLFWKGAKGYRPGSARCTEAAIATFQQLEESAREATGDPAGATIDRINAMLAGDGQRAPRPRIHQPNHCDQQLPVADRA